MRDRLRILILTHNFPRFRDDFSGVFISLLARRLAEHDITPFVLAPHDANVAEQEEIESVHVRRFRYAADAREETLAYRGNMHQQVFGSPSGLFRFRRFLRCFREAALETIKREQIDVLFGHWLVPAGMVMKSIRRRTSLPMILSSHGTDIRLLSRYRRLVYPYFNGLVHSLKRWTVVSSFLKEKLLEIDSNLAGLVDVLPLPHDENLFYPDNTIDREPNLVVSVARFTEQKRVLHLVRAFALVHRENALARLELYGTGPLQSDIEQLIKDLALQQCITVFPPIPHEELGRVYNRAAAVVLNSCQEGFGLTLSEAMLCGTPVIGTNSGGITDIVTHDQTGLLVELDDVNSLSRAILYMLRDDSLCRRLGEAGRRFAATTYASAPLASRYADILRNAAHGTMEHGQ